MRRGPRRLTTAVLLAAAAVAGCRPVGPLRLQGPAHDELAAAWAAAAPRPSGALPPPASAPPPAAAAPPVLPASVGSEPVTLQLRGSELGHALLLLAEQAGLPLVLSGDFSEPVDVSLPGVPLRAALEMLLATYDCRVEVLGDIVVVQRQDPAGTLSRVFELRSVSATVVQPELALLLGGDGAVVANASRNVVLVTAPAAAMAQVESYVAAVDRPEQQVLIEARILEVNRTELQELGTSLAFDDLVVDDWTGTFVTNLLTSSTDVLVTLSKESGSVDAALNLLRQLVGLQVLSTPRLVALNAHEARLEIVSEVPYVNATTTTESSGNGVGAQTIQEVEFKLVGLDLRVTPTIQEDGLVSLAVEQSVSEQIDTFLSIPVVDRRTITTSFLVAEGDTIMIGGILRDRALSQTTGVPLLMDIPWLGRAFRSEVDRVDASELVILMTPRLVDPRQAAAAGAQPSAKVAVPPVADPG